MPLDEYYYSKKEGDPTYREEKAEFRFKVGLCQMKMSRKWKRQGNAISMTFLL